MNTTPQVPVGLSTKVGLIATALAALAAAVAAVIDGDHTPETIAALVTAGLTLYGVIRSRGEQAAALYSRQEPLGADVLRDPDDDRDLHDGGLT